MVNIELFLTVTGSASPLKLEIIPTIIMKVKKELTILPINIARRHAKNDLKKPISQQCLMMKNNVCIVFIQR